ncbi:polyprenyl diphosphate synthase [Candidatus Pacebacteria bacterium]|nr:polyprenyl diphosphate synthase [Candidatus Paceibacterota bacterium]
MKEEDIHKEEENRRLEIMISGRVQGVFFRISAKEIAKQNNLFGFAENLEDGRVHIIAEGGEAGLRNLLDWSYRGSILARVDGLSFNWLEATGEFNKFDSIHNEDGFVEDKKQALKNLSKRVLKRFKYTGSVPNHLVIIPDGNRRWAEERKLSAWEGHKQGIEQIKELISEITNIGIKYVTFWGFSTDNWKRDDIEVKYLMEAFKKSLKSLREESFKYEIRFHHFGRKDRLPKSLIKEINKLEEDTKHFHKHHLAVALDYGGRNELVRAMEALGNNNKDISEENISEALDTKDFPDVDLVIRTSGERRTSGIMPWQAVHAEYYFSPIYFPDFSPDELRLAVEDFGGRKRRFGGK